MAKRRTGFRLKESKEFKSVAKREHKKKMRKKFREQIKAHRRSGAEDVPLKVRIAAGRWAKTHNLAPHMYHITVHKNAMHKQKGKGREETKTEYGKIRYNLMRHHRRHTRGLRKNLKALKEWHRIGVK